MPHLEAHRAGQAIAKSVLERLAADIGPLDTERTIAERAVELLAKAGIRQTWYYQCPALVLLGSRSCLSVSGRSYEPAEERAGEYNVVTVDLSPASDGVWGDCARTFFIEEGVCTASPRSPEFREGTAVQQSLHEQLRAFATPDTTFDGLFRFADRAIRERGFENVDFLGNVGHSIASRLEDRCYIEAGNARRLSDVALFTFEPHIRKSGGVWGFKHENIYYFEPDGRLNEL